MSEPLLEPTPPQNLEAEESVLGAMLMSGAAIAAVADVLGNGNDFYRESHAIIYRAAVAMHRRGEPVDVITLCDELEQRKLLDQVGWKGQPGKARIHELGVIVPASANAAHYARIVREAATRRRDEVIRREWERDGMTDDLRTLIRERIARDDEQQPASGPATPERKPLVFVRGDEFIEQPILRADPLVGEGKDALMMPGSLAILAGIGGAGKTTLSLHALAHWASGLPWFGIATPRPIRMVIIENEGPHDPYVEKVKEFAHRFHDCPCGDGQAHGDGGAFLFNCHFLDAPWGHFTFDDPGCAEELRGFVRDNEIDLVVANPLGRLGMKGAGTPEETRSFLELLFRAGLNEDFAALLLHHFSKVGRHVPIVSQLSGDWGPHPDLILAMEPDGERKSKLSFGKVRWGDQGRPPLLLEWLTDPGGPIGYRGQSAPAGIDDDVIFDRIDDFIASQPGPVGVAEVRKGVKGNNQRLGEALLRGVETGRYISSGGARPRYRIAPELGDESDLDYQPSLEED